MRGTAVAQWSRCCAKNRRIAGSIPAGVSDFSIKSFRSHYRPGVDSASNRNEYQEHFLRGKGGRCVRLTTLPPSCAVVTKSGNLNFLEPSGPVQACNGTALPLHSVKKVHVSNGKQGYARSKTTKIYKISMISVYIAIFLIHLVTSHKFL